MGYGCIGGCISVRAIKQFICPFFIFVIFPNTIETEFWRSTYTAFCPVCPGFLGV